MTITDQVYMVLGYGEVQNEFEWIITRSCISFPDCRPFTVVFNSLRHTDAIWRHGFESTFVKVMACCLTAPIHYLNQCWRAINEILWHSLQGNTYTNIQDINPKVVFEIYTVEILAILPRDQRVNDTLKIDCQRHFAGEARSFNPGKVIT